MTKQNKKNISETTCYENTLYDLKPKFIVPYIVELVQPYSEKLLSSIFNTKELISKLNNMSILETIDHVILNANLKTDSDRNTKSAIENWIHQNPNFPVLINNSLIGIKQIELLGKEKIRQFIIDDRKINMMQEDLWKSNHDINGNIFYITKIELCNFINNIHYDTSITRESYKFPTAFPYL